MNFFRNLFGKEPSSASLAKQRLQVVLVQDHLSMTPGTMEAIKAEIMEVISRHLEIDPEGVEVAVERRGHGDELVANIPVRRNLELSDEVLDSPHSIVTQEAANRVWAAQAVLEAIITQGI